MHRPKHIFFQWFGEWELGYVLTQTVSFSTVRQGRGTYLFADISKHLGEWELRSVWTQPSTFSIVRQSGNFVMYGPNHLLFQLCGRVGTSLCMDPTIQFFNCLVEWELRYVWTQPLSFSIVQQSGNFAMYRPNNLVFQLFGRVGTSLCMNPAI